MSLGAQIAIGAWSLFTVAVFLALPPRQALLRAMIAGVLFLPVIGFPVSGLRSKLMITMVVVSVSALLLAPGPLLRLRPHFIDLPVAIWCVWPIASSLANNLGLYDGLSAAFENVLVYAAPYLLGRAYCADLQGLRHVATSIFLGGALYVPFCLWEIRFSPQLHRLLYGFHQHSFVQTIRFGGFRPVVFMDHGLMVAMWITAASLVGFWSWRVRAVGPVFGIPVGALVAALFCTAVLCKSAGALVLLAAGMIVSFLVIRKRMRLPLLVLLLASPTYLALRVAGRWSEAPVLEFARDLSGAERSESLQFRFRNEEMLLARAMQRPVTGWGRWGRFLVIDPETGRSFTIPDGLWIIALGEAGLVGLASLTAMLLLPSLVFLVRFHSVEWNTPDLAPVAALAVLLALYMIDNLANAMLNPLYFIAAGGLAALPARPRPLRSALSQPGTRGRLAPERSTSTVSARAHDP